jgi:hypothetical protein
LATAFAKDNNGSLPPRKILLMTDILVRCQQNFKPSRFSSVEQVAILYFVPSQRSALFDNVTAEGSDDSARGGVVQQDKHLRSTDWRIGTAGRKFEYGLDLFARDRELLHEFLNGHAVFQIFEHDGNGHARSLENPRVARLSGNGFYCGAW